MSADMFLEHAWFFAPNPTFFTNVLSTSTSSDIYIIFIGFIPDGRKPVSKLCPLYQCKWIYMARNCMYMLELRLLFWSLTQGPLVKFCPLVQQLSPFLISQYTYKALKVF